MGKETIKTVAFDLGGVIAKQDWSKVTEREKALVKAYLNRFNPERVKLEAIKGGSVNPTEFLREAEASIDILFPKIHVLPEESKKALEVLKELKIAASLWTNNILSINKWFEMSGLYDYIDPAFICNSMEMEDGSVDKPELEFYRRALRKLKQAEGQILYIDDTLKNVIAGLYMGIPSIQYSMFDQRDDQKDLSGVIIDGVDIFNRGK